MLATLAKTYVAAMNSDGVPSITSAWAHVAEEETRAALDDSYLSYADGMAKVPEQFPMDSGDLQSTHKQLKKAAMATLRQRGVGDNVDASIDTLRTKIRNFYGEACVKNADASTAECSSLIEKLFRGQVQSRAEGFSDAEDVRRAYSEMQAEYLSQARGPSKHSVLEAFTAQKMAESFREVMDKVTAGAAVRLADFVFIF